MNDPSRDPSTVVAPSAPAHHDFASMRVADFCTALAAQRSTPGGGAVAGLTIAHAAALASMVVAYSRGKPVFAALESDGEAIARSLHHAMEAALIAARRDADAYEVLNTLWKRPKDDPERLRQWDAAVRGATAAPLFLVRLAVEVLEQCQELAGRTTKSLDSDLAIAADLARTAAHAAAWNVQANLPFASSDDDRAAAKTTLDALLTATREASAAVRASLTARGSVSPA